jgi:hypothetical protein
MPVPMSAVRPVAVDVVRFLVDVLVDVWLLDLALVPVPVMEVGVDMGVGVDGPVVVMGVDVFFPDDERDRRGHEQA